MTNISIVKPTDEKTRSNKRVWPHKTFKKNKGKSLGIIQQIFKGKK